MTIPALPADIASTVRRALSEDIGNGDLTADLIPAGETAQARVICREAAVLCGTAWVDEVFRQLGGAVEVSWLLADGADVQPGAAVCQLAGNTRTLLTGERTALNFLQLLSGTATTTRRYVTLLANTGTRILDTRKTIPGLRTAQKYAVACGGGCNHRMGLYDAILIKENHIRAAGGIAKAVHEARRHNRQIEVEVEDLDQLAAAIDAGADTIMLDNFDTDRMRQAVIINDGRARLEASGNMDMKGIPEVAATGVDFISVGALTKNVQAIDFSMRIM